MDHNRDTSLFLKFIESRCQNIKTSIDSLLVELCNQLSHSNNQVLQKQVSSPYCNSAAQESNISGQAFSTESGRINPINLDHALSRRKALLPSCGELDADKKQFDHKSTYLKKEEDMNQSIDDKQYESSDLQVQSVDNKYQNISPKKMLIRSINKEKDLEKNVIPNTKFKKSKHISEDLNQDQLEYLKSLESLDFDPKLMRFINYRDNDKFLQFQKTINQIKYQKAFTPKKSNLETNLFILNHIQKMFLEQLSINMNDYEIYLSDVNKKYQQNSSEL